MWEDAQKSLLVPAQVRSHKGTEFQFDRWHSDEDRKREACGGIVTIVLCFWESKNGSAIKKAVWSFIKKVNHGITYDPEIHSKICNQKELKQIQVYTSS